MISQCLAYVQSSDAKRSDTYKALGAVGAELHPSSTNVLPSRTVHACRVLRRTVDVRLPQGRFFGIEEEDKVRQPPHS